MASTPNVYVLCDANCKWEGMTKEQILTAITQAVNEGTISDIDTGFVQTIKTVNGHALKFFVGEQSEYDTLTEADKEGLFAIITNDTNKDGLLNAIATLQTRLTDLETKIGNGSSVAGVQKRIKLYANSLRSTAITPSEHTGIDNATTIYTDANALAGRTFEIVTYDKGIFTFKVYTTYPTASFSIGRNNVLCFQCVGNNISVYFNGSATVSDGETIHIQEIYELVTM